MFGMKLLKRVHGLHACYKVVAGCPQRLYGTSRVVDLAGVFTPITTPFSEDCSIAYDKLEANLQKWSCIPLKGYLVEGSTGEVVYLTEAERVSLVEHVCKQVPASANKLVLGGSGCESTKATIDLSNKMASAGVDAVMVVTPCYYKGAMKDSAMVAHFRTVADHSAVPVILYSVPVNTGLDLSVEAIVDLAHHPNIIAIKDSGGDISKFGSLVHKTKNLDFQVLAGSASYLLAALHVGCVGGVCAAANVIGSDVCELYRLFVNHQYEDAKQLQHKLIAPNAAVTKLFGVAGVKQAMDSMGLYGGPTRPPMLPLTHEQKSLLRKIFVDAGYLSQ